VSFWVSLRSWYNKQTKKRAGPFNPQFPTTGRVSFEWNAATTLLLLSHHSTFASNSHWLHGSEYVLGTKLCAPMVSWGPNSERFGPRTKKWMRTSTVLFNSAKSTLRWFLRHWGSYAQTLSFLACAASAMEQALLRDDRYITLCF